MKAPEFKTLLLCVCGGVAAYKSAELVRRLRDDGWQVRVAMTAAAQQFVGALTFQALSGHRVHTDLFDAEAEAAMGHIELARWADVVLVAPATANCLARLAHGLADDLVSTLCLATRAPVIVAPAMNQQMWAAPATQANRKRLLERGVRVWGPAAGSQACGEEGPGRLLEPGDLVVRLQALRAPGCLNEQTVLITAGPTREPIDPVRYLSNRSSGKMGFALAQAAQEQGAEVILVSGPSPLETPHGVQRIDVGTAAEMHRAVSAHAGRAHVFIAAAAVADYRPRAAKHKLKKGAQVMNLALDATVDIVAEVAGMPGAPFTVGFAAETENLEKNARTKLHAKGLDMIAANQVGDEDVGFDSDENALAVLWPGGAATIPRSDKLSVARHLVLLIRERMDEASHKGENTRPALGR